MNWEGVVDRNALSDWLEFQKYVENLRSEDNSVGRLLLSHSYSTET